MTLGTEIIADAPDTAPLTTLQAALFIRLDRSITELWAEARTGKFWGHVVSRGFDPGLYRLAMAQIFHYTRHNSINQAVSALRAEPGELALLRFVYGHAKEEVGHERLILSDLRSIGLLAGDEITDMPLPATDALINYLYGVALREGPVPRLGYSYWAESVYRQIGPLLLAARDSLALTYPNMSFFAAHAEIDARHAEQVRSAICRAVTTSERAEAIHRVAVTSLWLTIQILEQTFGVTSRAAGARP